MKIGPNGSTLATLNILKDLPPAKDKNETTAQFWSRVDKADLLDEAELVPGRLKSHSHRHWFWVPDSGRPKEPIHPQDLNSITAKGVLPREASIQTVSVHKAEKGRQ